MLAAMFAMALSACGFHPAGSVGQLPQAMQVTYVQSSEPYGYLVNLLRRMIVAHGAQVTEYRAQASGVLDIMQTQLVSRVLAVNSHGQPLEYDVHYEVRFRLLDADGKVLLDPQSIGLRRNLAYNVNIELGANRRQKQLVEGMQREAVRLIMLRLEALGHSTMDSRAP